MSKCIFTDKETLRAIGRELWQMRQDKHMYLRTVSYHTKVPERMIEGMENGKFLKHNAFRRLTDFYGKKMRIVFE